MAFKFSSSSSSSRAAAAASGTGFRSGPHMMDDDNDDAMHQFQQPQPPSFQQPKQQQQGSAFGGFGNGFGTGGSGGTRTSTMDFGGKGDDAAAVIFSAPNATSSPFFKFDNSDPSIPPFGASFGKPSNEFQFISSSRGGGGRRRTSRAFDFSTPTATTAATGPKAPPNAFSACFGAAKATTGIKSRECCCDHCDGPIVGTPETYSVCRYENVSDHNKLNSVAPESQQFFCSFDCMARSMMEAHRDVYGDDDDNDKNDGTNL